MSPKAMKDRLRAAVGRLGALVRARRKARVEPAKPVLLPATTAWLANIRAEALAPRALVVVVQGPRGSIALLPEDIVGKSDEELLMFIAARLDE